MHLSASSPNGNSLSSSSSFYSASNSSAAVRPSTLASVAASAAALVNGVRSHHHHPTHADLTQGQSSRHHHTLSNSSTQSDLPSALVDKQFVYYSNSSSSSRLRSLRRRLWTRKGLGSLTFLVVIALFSLVYLQPSLPFWSDRRVDDVPHHQNTNHDRYRYDFDYPLDKTRQQAQEQERQKAHQPANDPWQAPDDRNSDLEDSIRNADSPPVAGSEEAGPMDKAVDPESIVLYRILGNDLPPRHRPGQTLSNVRFILEHEPEFNKTRKLWVLNRIVDQQAESSILQLLNHHRQEYIRIPFVEKDYLRQDFKLEDFPEPDFFSSDDYSTFSKVAKLRVLDYTYHDKNRYAMNNVSPLGLCCTNWEPVWPLRKRRQCFFTCIIATGHKNGSMEHSRSLRHCHI